jgi:uncharacterized membrane protein YqiK
MNGIVIGVFVLIGVVVIGAILTTFASTLLGLVVISEREAGLVVKKFAAKPLPAGRLVALNGEAGYQADTLIGDITPPAALMLTRTDRKIAEEQRKTFEVQQAAQTQRQKLVRETAMADIQSDMVKAEQGVNISELRANSQIKQATGEAEAIRLRAGGEAEAIRLPGQAKAEAYRAGVTALGPESYTALQVMQIVGDQKVRVVPDVAVSGAGGGSSMIEGLMGMMLRNQVGSSQAANTPPATPQGK